MTFLALTLSLVLGAPSAADGLVKQTVKGLTVSTPGVWKRSVEDGTHKWVAPSGDAFLTLDVGAVQTDGMTGTTCRDKIVQSLGGDGWQLLTLGGAPAAKRILVDEANEDGGQVESWTFVGCNGKTTWALIVSMDVKKKARFSALAEKVANSIAYR